MKDHLVLISFSANQVKGWVTNINSKLNQRCYAHTAHLNKCGLFPVWNPYLYCLNHLYFCYIFGLLKQHFHSFLTNTREWLLTTMYNIQAFLLDQDQSRSCQVHFGPQMWESEFLFDFFQSTIKAKERAFNDNREYNNLYCYAIYVKLVIFKLIHKHKLCVFNDDEQWYNVWDWLLFNT